MIHTLTAGAEPLRVRNSSKFLHDTSRKSRGRVITEHEQGYPIGALEYSRLRKLKEAGFAEMAKLPELDALCREAKSHFGTEIAAVTLLTEELQILKARAGIDVENTPRNVAFCNYTILEDATFVVLDTQSDLRFSNNPLTTGVPFIRFYAGAPLIYLADLRLGAFCLLDGKARDSFTNGEKAELVDFADRAVQMLVAQLGKVL